MRSISSLRVTAERALPAPAAEVGRRSSSAEQAALYIRRLIFDGRLEPGRRLPQDEIAQALGVSRIPVREALIALEREGWVSLRSNRGAFVNALDAQTVIDHFELYGRLYGFAVRRAMARRPSDLAERLAAIRRDFAGSGDPSSAFRAALAFHSAVADAAKSPRLQVALRAMSTLVPGDMFVLVPGSTEIEKRGMAAITRAVERGDAEGAAKEYAKLLQRMGDKVIEVFEERGLFSEVVEA